MAKFNSKSEMKNVPVIAMISDKQVKKNADGKILGYWVDLQVDQSNLTVEDARNGRAQTNPSLSSHTARNGKYVDHGVYYTTNQVDIMRGVGTTVPTAKGCAIAFTTNLFEKKDGKGNSCVLAMLPKDLEFAKTPEERAKIEYYNKMNPISGPNYEFTKESLENHMLVTNEAKRCRDEKYRQVDGKSVDPLPDRLKGVKDYRIVLHEESDAVMAHVVTSFMMGLAENNGMTPIGHDLMEDRDAFMKEARNHSGVITVYRPADEVSFSRNLGAVEDVFDEMVERGGPEAFRHRGCDFVWYETTGRQLKDRLAPEVLDKVASENPNQDFGPNDCLKGYRDYGFSNFNVDYSNNDQVAVGMMMRDAINYTIANEGGLHPVAESLLKDPEAFMDEFRESHDGAMLVDPTANSVYMCMDKDAVAGIPYLYGLQQAASGGDVCVVWYDDLSRQIDTKIKSLDKQVSEEYVEAREEADERAYGSAVPGTANWRAKHEQDPRVSDKMHDFGSVVANGGTGFEDGGFDIEDFEDNPF
ncbi:MAG: hypothetical protein HDQ88_08305 [Clostridia bacterium]|nr:hypothetical protein [Clostridia bacterium]